MSEITSAFFPVVFQIIANILIEEVRLMQALPTEIEDLQNNVDMVNATLQVATMNLSEPLKLWLYKLRDIGYEAIDLLDDHNTELLRRQLVRLAELRNNLSSINIKRVIYRYNMSHEIKNVSSRMEKVCQMRTNFGLNVNESSSTRDRLEITSSLPPTPIVGRENEKNEILRVLIPYNNVRVGILAIHGLGRIGKTTLAQLIYKELENEGHVNMALWVHVSDKFDLEKVTRSILESMYEMSFDGISNLDTVQKLIQKKLKGKRYLLVLDDFGNENRHEWEKLIRPLHQGAPGSVIIVTTTNSKAAEMVSTFPSYQLKKLSEHDYCSLVYHYVSRNELNARAKLNALSSEIMKKCWGMPEEAISLGDQLRREPDEKKWNGIIEKWGEGHTFSEEKKIIRNSMMLHYSRVPSYLKPCLAYCSIIPKSLQFEKEWIVQLWMAQNFIAKQSERTIQDIGNTYFDWLVAQSFFQKTGINLNKGRYEYCIPDMVRDVVRQTSADDCCIFELGRSDSDKPAKTIRHISINFTSEQLSSPNPLKSITKIYHCKDLYTLLVVGGFLTNKPMRLPNDLPKRLRRLRTLDLSFCNLGSLPKNIGKMKHLRCLQLQKSNIQELPESVGDLYNLQTLDLRNCFSLRKLPKDTWCLKKLLHLDLHLDHLPPNVIPKLEFMPPYIGLLTNLQVLCRFVVSTMKHCGLKELKDLNSLQGGLSISNLDLVENCMDAAEANLQGKRHIKRLEFLWRGDRGLHDCGNEREKTELVLENLKPSNSIEELNIVGYTGGVLPSWLGSVYLSNLHAISLSDCTNCIELPPLGNLPLLQEIYIKRMSSVRTINCNFCGNNPICFPSLKKLVFENMASVEEWTGHEYCELPRLSELVLKDCANLKRLTHNFPSLTKLTTESLPALLGLRKYPSLKHLTVAVETSNWIWDSWSCLSSLHSLTLSQLSWTTLPPRLQKIHDSLQNLEISDCKCLTMLPRDWIPSCVTYLCIRQCPMLRELPKGLETLKVLEDLEIQDCKNLKFLPELNNLKSLTRLEISGCHSLLFLPSEGLPEALHFLSISDCPSFSEQFKDLQSVDRRKIRNVFSVWIDQNHFNSGRTQGESST